jgi:hypothetical protein
VLWTIEFAQTKQILLVLHERMQLIRRLEKLQSAYSKASALPSVSTVHLYWRKNFVVNRASFYNNAADASAHIEHMGTF